MMNERELRDEFRKLRAADEAEVPDFRGVMVKQHPPAVTDSWGIGPMVLGAAAAFAGIAIVIASNSTPAAQTQLVVPAEVIALSNWRPMTDSLLHGQYAMPLQDEPLDTRLPDTSTDTSSD